ncbi:MAG TPA: CaiB/BaiF CoA-transferase family protein [Candidatus Limnocylindrales bacterium]|nr:CaiB/BaiF CoA-transferase family protein [Candidatus Limnocylindrales bacterium]
MLDETAPSGSGPLSGIIVVELGGRGAVPFVAMLLADMGASVIRVRRPGDNSASRLVTDRGKHVLDLDLTRSAARTEVNALATKSDVIIEGFRPGTAERLGVGPSALLAINPRLVYARMTGWGQDGPLAQTAGHDINFIGLTGALHAMGQPTVPPAPPLSLLGDYGGGALALISGILAALLNRCHGGQGQIVDASVLDGTITALAGVLGRRAAGVWSDRRGGNEIDGSAPYYTVYACADDRYVAVGALEARRRSALLDGLGFATDDPVRDGIHDPRHHELARQILADRFRTRARDEWIAIFESADACVTPVLSLDEAIEHPHNRFRSAFLTDAGATQPAPSPRFSSTPSGTRQRTTRKLLSFLDVSGVDGTTDP